MPITDETRRVKAPPTEPLAASPDEKHCEERQRSTMMVLFISTGDVAIDQPSVVVQSIGRQEKQEAK